VTFVRSEGQDVMALNAKRETGTNVLEVMANLKRQIEEGATARCSTRAAGAGAAQVY
jgi:multidrug efflux pump subunit AcrB